SQQFWTGAVPQIGPINGATGPDFQLQALSSQAFLPIATSPPPTASGLAGRVYADANNDGRPEAGEPGVPGVTITLSGTLSAGGTITATTVTDADGAYRFEHLPPGTYALTETPPAGLVGGLETLGNLDGTVGPGRFSNIHLDGFIAGTGY